MGRNAPAVQEPSDDELDEATRPELTEIEQLRADLLAQRARAAKAEAEAKNLRAAFVDGEDTEQESGQFVNARKLTHQHDIERLHRLGKLSPAAVMRFQELGNLPRPCAHDGCARVMPPGKDGPKFCVEHDDENGQAV